MARKRNRRKLPARWPRLGDGKPIERCSPSIERDYHFAEREQGRRMLELMRHFGIENKGGAEPWYQVSVRLAAMLDPALTTVDYVPPKGPRWQGPNGYELIQLVECVRAEFPAMTSDAQALRVLRRERPDFAAIPVRKLAANLSLARKKYLPAKKLRTWDGRVVTRR
jgi:hypothetical protein